MRLLEQTYWIMKVIISIIIRIRLRTCPRCQNARNLSSYELVELAVILSTFDLASPKSASSTTVLNRFTGGLVNFLLLIRPDFQRFLTLMSTRAGSRISSPVRYLIIYRPYYRKHDFRPSCDCSEEDFNKSAMMQNSIASAMIAISLMMRLHYLPIPFIQVFLCLNIFIHF